MKCILCGEILRDCKCNVEKFHYFILQNGRLTKCCEEPVIAYEFYEEKENLKNVICVQCFKEGRRF